MQIQYQFMDFNILEPIVDFVCGSGSELENVNALRRREIKSNRIDE